jgi:hypothetical protein
LSDCDRWHRLTAAPHTGGAKVDTYAPLCFSTSFFEVLKIYNFGFLFKGERPE